MHYLIVSNPRQGTKFLQSLLPGLQLPEIFRRRVTGTGLPVPVSELPRVSKNGRSASDLLFHEMSGEERLAYYRENRGDRSSVKVFFLDMPVPLPEAHEVKVLRLIRSNALETFLSLRLALETQEFKHRVETLAPFSVDVSAYGGFKHMIRDETRYLSTIEPYCPDTIYYESLASGAVRNIGDTQLRAVSESDCVHQESSRLYSRVVNYQEVRSWFRDDLAYWRKLGYCVFGENFR